MPKGVFTPKRKAFPLHEDMYYWTADPSMPADALHSAVESQVASVLISIAEDKPWLIQNPRVGYTRTIASWNYPQCHYYLLNALAQTPPGYYIRPGYLMNYLRETSQDYYWPISIVGHLVGAVAINCKDMYMVDHQYVDDEKHVPFAMGRDSKGRYYVFDPQGGNEGRLWVMRLRRIMYDEAVKAMDAEAAGRHDLGHYEEQTAVAALAKFIPEPVRSKEGFLGNLRPGERVLRASPARAYRESI